MSAFTVTERTPNNCWVEGGRACVVEMRAKWAGTSLQLAVSVFQPRYGRTLADVTYHKRQAGVLRHCPGLEEALKWCAARRMGVKIEMVRCDSSAISPETFAVMDRCWERCSRTIVFDPIAKGYAVLYSHRLIFKKEDHAFEFKMRWL